MASIVNLIIFLAVKEFWNYVKKWQSYAVSLVYYFLRHSVKHSRSAYLRQRQVSDLELQSDLRIDPHPGVFRISP